MDGRGWRLVRARRPVPASVRRFAQRARQRRIRAAVPWLVALAVLALVGGAVAVVYRTSLLGVRHIEVIGEHAPLTVQEIKVYAAIRPGAPLAALDTGAIGRRVLLIPAVRTVVVRWRLPGTVQIAVTQRVAVAAVPLVGGAELLDASGMPFQDVGAVPAGLPTVRLSSPGPDDDTTAAALQVLAALTPGVRSVLGELQATAPTRIQLGLTDGQTVIWGDDTQNEAKCRVLLQLLADPANVASTTLDLSSPGVVAIR